MKTLREYGITDWAVVAYKTTLRAAHAKNYLLRRKDDRRFKDMALRMIQGKGYVIATPEELENLYNGLFKADAAAPDFKKKMIWAIDFFPKKRGPQMSFMPIR